MYKLTKNLDFQNSEGRILQGGKGKIPGVETPVIYYVLIPDPIIKLLVSVIQ